MLHVLSLDHHLVEVEMKQRAAMQVLLLSPSGGPRLGLELATIESRVVLDLEFRQGGQTQEHHRERVEAKPGRTHTG
jgi:hypothetical protein